MTMGRLGARIPGSWAISPNRWGKSWADPCVAMLFARGFFGVCDRELTLEDLPWGGGALAMRCGPTR